MKTEDILKHRSCKRQKMAKGHLHAHLKTRLRMMPSSLLGCASQFVSGLYPTYRPYIYIYTHKWVHVIVIYTNVKLCIYIYACVRYIYTYIIHTYKVCTIVQSMAITRASKVPRLLTPGDVAWALWRMEMLPQARIPTYTYISIYVCLRVCV